MQFNGKTALITGGSSGIGLALAREMAAKGVRLVLLARTPEKLASAVQSLNAENPEFHSGLACDVSDPQQVKDVIERMVASHGVPDILVNSAGVVHPAYVQDLTLEQFHWMMDINFFGTVHITQALLKGFIERRSGYIVNINSFIGKYSGIGYGAYGASKGALRAYTETLRHELKPRGIFVSIVHPTDTDTPQLAYENLHKPPELRYIYPEMGANPPENTAKAILHGMEKHKYEILPDSTAVLFVNLFRFLGTSGTHAVEDFLLRRAKRIARKRQV